MTGRRNPSAPKVFISHSHQDRHSAVVLQKILEEEQAQAFLDQDTIDTLDNLPERVREHIGECDFLLLLWSANAAASAWVQREWQTAQKLGKTIIPYALDATSLPFLLDELVYIDKNDQQHGNAKLIKLILGGPSDPSHMFPGLWDASVELPGIVKGIYSLELRDNGQVEGTGGVSDTAFAGVLAGELGLRELLSMRTPVHGSWSYDRGSRTLTINISAELFGRQQNDTIRIRTTGHEKGEITGQDLGGRIWKLRRKGDRPLTPVEKERQHLRDVLKGMIDKGSDNPTLPIAIAAVCLGAQTKSQYDLGLPMEEAKRITQANEQTWAAALQDFVQALIRDGWIS